MPFVPRWSPSEVARFDELRAAAAASLGSRGRSGKANVSRAEGLFKQVEKCVRLL